MLYLLTFWQTRSCWAAPFALSTQGANALIAIFTWNRKTTTNWFIDRRPVWIFEKVLMGKQNSYTLLNLLTFTLSFCRTPCALATNGANPNIAVFTRNGKTTTYRYLIIWNDGLVGKQVLNSFLYLLTFWHTKISFSVIFTLSTIGANTRGTILAGLSKTTIRARDIYLNDG